MFLPRLSLPVVFIILAFSMGLGCQNAPHISRDGDSALNTSDEPRLKNLRQLTTGTTIQGIHWSMDGTYLTYLDAGKVMRVSVDGKIRNGIQTDGLSDSSAFSSNGKWVLFSHKSGATESSADQKILSRNFQLYRMNVNGKDLHKNFLPIEPAAPSVYNGNLTVCKNGSVLFSSTRGGDVDLYTATLDSKGVLSSPKIFLPALGFDGDASFSEDCSSVVWIGSRPKSGTKTEEYVTNLRNDLFVYKNTEIWTAKTDGSQVRQITQLKSPLRNPVFSFEGNILFENQGSIYLVRPNGTALEKVTQGKSKNSSPSFSPDGKYFAFASNRNAKNQSGMELFIADWNPFAEGALVTDQDPYSVNRTYSMVKELSSSDMNGRSIGSGGIQEAEEYITEMYEKAGILDFSELYSNIKEVKNYRQSIDVTTESDVDWSHTSLKADWKNLQPKVDFAPAGFSSSDSVEGQLVDFGYGRESDIKKSLKGKIALIKEGKSTDAQLKSTAFFAKFLGAKGVLFWDKEKPLPVTGEDIRAYAAGRSTAIAADIGIPVGFLSRNIAPDWIAHSPMPKIYIKFNINKKSVQTTNILGWVGKDCGQQDPVIIAAHYDHLGKKSEHSLESFQSGLHHGADDNASGVAGLLEVARILKERNGCYWIVALTAHESGAQGSVALLEWMKQYNIQPKAFIDLHRIGRMQSNKFERIDSAPQVSGRPSDRLPFYWAGTKTVEFTTGNRSEHLKASDTEEKINPTGITLVSEEVAEYASSLFKKSRKK